MNLYNCKLLPIFLIIINVSLSASFSSAVVNSEAEDDLKSLTRSVFMLNQRDADSYAMSLVKSDFYARMGIAKSSLERLDRITSEFVSFQREYVELEKAFQDFTEMDLKSIEISRAKIEKLRESYYNLSKAKFRLIWKPAQNAEAKHNVILGLKNSLAAFESDCSSGRADSSSDDVIINTTYDMKRSEYNSSTNLLLSFFDVLNLNQDNSKEEVKRITAEFEELKSEDYVASQYRKYCRGYVEQFKDLVGTIEILDEGGEAALQLIDSASLKQDELNRILQKSDIKDMFSVKALNGLSDQQKFNFTKNQIILKMGIQFAFLNESYKNLDFSKIEEHDEASFGSMLSLLNMLERMQAETPGTMQYMMERDFELMEVSLDLHTQFYRLAEDSIRVLMLKSDESKDELTHRIKKFECEFNEHYHKHPNFKDLKMIDFKLPLLKQLLDAK